MSTAAAIIALVLGILILSFWAVSLLLTILGWGLVIAGAVVLIKYPRW